MKRLKFEIILQLKFWVLLGILYSLFETTCKAEKGIEELFPDLVAIEYIYTNLSLYISLYIYKFTSIIVSKHGNAKKPTNQWKNASKRNWA